MTKIFFRDFFLYYWFDDNFAKLFYGTYFRNFEMAKSIKFFLIGCVIFYRIVSLNIFFISTEIEWGEHRSEQPRQESFDRWKTKLRRRHGGGRTCRQKIEDLRGSSSIRGDNLRVSGPACTQTRGHPNSVCTRSQSRSSSCSLRSGKKSKEKWHLHHQHSAEKHTKRKDPVKAHRLYYRHLKQY